MLCFKERTTGASAWLGFLPQRFWCGRIWKEIRSKAIKSKSRLMIFPFNILFVILFVCETFWLWKGSSPQRFSNIKKKNGKKACWASIFPIKLKEWRRDMEYPRCLVSRILDLQNTYIYICIFKLSFTETPFHHPWKPPQPAWLLPHSQRWQGFPGAWGRCMYVLCFKERTTGLQVLVLG